MEQNISTIGLIVYGGVYLQTGVVCEDAIDSYLGSRAAVGTVPFTMQCLSNPNVLHHDGANKSDPKFDKYQIIQSRKRYSCVRNCWQWVTTLTI